MSCGLVIHSLSLFVTLASFTFAHWKKKKKKPKMCSSLFCFSDFLTEEIGIYNHGGMWAKLFIFWSLYGSGILKAMHIHGWSLALSKRCLITKGITQIFLFKKMRIAMKVKDVGGKGNEEKKLNHLFTFTFRPSFVLSPPPPPTSPF